MQAFLGLGWGGGKILEKTDYVTEMILIKKRKANTNKKYFLSSPKMVSASLEKIQKNFDVGQPKDGCLHSKVGGLGFLF